MTLEEIKALPKRKAAFRRGFNRILNELGEYLLEPISTDRIIDTFINFGKWVGVENRIFYDPKIGFHSEPRRFGA